MWVQCMHSAHKFLHQQHKIIFISSKHQQMLFLGHQKSEAGSNFSNVHCLRTIVHCWVPFFPHQTVYRVSHFTGCDSNIYIPLLSQNLQKWYVINSKIIFGSEVCKCSKANLWFDDHRLWRFWAEIVHTL